MRTMFSVAGGILLAGIVILAVWFVLFVVVPDIRDTRAYERDERILSLQPEDIIKECGKPMSDTTDAALAGLPRQPPRYRMMKYPSPVVVDGGRLTVDINFERVGSRWEMEHLSLKDKPWVDFPRFDVRDTPCVERAATKYGKTLSQRVIREARPEPTAPVERRKPPLLPPTDCSVHSEDN